jgi:hypothetical protein
MPYAMHSAKPKLIYSHVARFVYWNTSKMPVSSGVERLSHFKVLPADLILKSKIEGLKVLPGGQSGMLAIPTAFCEILFVYLSHSASECLLQFHQFFQHAVRKHSVRRRQMLQTVQWHRNSSLLHADKKMG